MFDWESLKIFKNMYGARNSVLMAVMPTASTSQIMGSSSCIEPYISNMYRRTVLAGQYVVMNKYLIKYLDDSGLWTSEIRNYLMATNGSIQNISAIPQYIKDIYKTVWELKQRYIIELAADRQPFIDQSQSMNLFVEDLTYQKFNSLQFYAWNKKLKTRKS